MEALTLPLALAGLLMIFAALLLPRLFRRKTPARPVPRHVAFVPTAEEERRLSEARELLMQVDAFASRSFARLDTRMRVLEALIRDADTAPGGRHV